MKGSIVLIVIVLALVGLFAYSYLNPETKSPSGTEQSFQAKVAKAGGLIDNNPIDFKQEAKEIAAKVEKKSSQVTAKAADQMKAQEESLAKVNQEIQDKKAEMQAQLETAAATAKAKADEMSRQIQDMLAQAKSLLDEGNYTKASETAKSILAMKPDSAEAKTILAQAKEKIAAMAAQTTEKFQTELSDKAGEAKAALMNVGQ
ncbi:MAG: hypothetical protein K8I00_02270 [Candidatus Omnitrophica bacterium]|nr:hypothetical protein [Candidatus Omnitrophota bacterium]